MLLLDGKKLADELKQEIKLEVEQLVAAGGKQLLNFQFYFLL